MKETVKTVASSLLNRANGKTIYIYIGAVSVKSTSGKAG